MCSNHLIISRADEEGDRPAARVPVHYSPVHTALVDIVRHCLKDAFRYFKAVNGTKNVICCDG